MIRFDEVLSETVRLVEAAPLANDLVAVTVIRDLKGRAKGVWGARQQSRQ